MLLCQKLATELIWCSTFTSKSHTQNCINRSESTGTSNFKCMEMCLHPKKTQKPAVLIFSRVKSEKNHHPVVVSLIINESPASSDVENRQGKHWPLPTLPVPLNLSLSVSSSLLMFKFSGKYDLAVIYSRWKQPHLVSPADSILIVAQWQTHKATCRPNSTKSHGIHPHSDYLVSTQRHIDAHIRLLMHLSSA